MFHQNPHAYSRTDNRVIHDAAIRNLTERIAQLVSAESDTTGCVGHNHVVHDHDAGHQAIVVDRMQIANRARAWQRLSGTRRSVRCIDRDSELAGIRDKTGLNDQLSLVTIMIQIAEGIIGCRQQSCAGHCREVCGERDDRIAGQVQLTAGTQIPSIPAVTQ